MRAEKTEDGGWNPRSVLECVFIVAADVSPLHLFISRVRADSRRLLRMFGALLLSCFSLPPSAFGPWGKVTRLTGIKSSACFVAKYFPLHSPPGRQRSQEGIRPALALESFAKDIIPLCAFFRLAP
jgi:hypothetical protein